MHALWNGSGRWIARDNCVSAINTNGTGPPSDDKAATTDDLQQLDQVMGVTITPRDGALKVRWTEVAEARGYKVQWAASGENYNSGSRQATVTSGLTTEHTIGALTNGTEYRTRVIATRYGVTDGPASDEATGTPIAGAGGGGQPQPQQSQTPLAASFVSVPPAHDGETEFSLELSFDAPVVQGSRARIRALLEVTGGSETRLRRKDGRRDRWEIQIEPSSQNTVTVMLSPSPPCGETGAVCTEDGRTFTTGLATQVHGPASGNNNWSEESAGPTITPVPALPPSLPTHCSGKSGMRPPQQSQTPLAASFVSVPPAHDGETEFSLELSFDAPVVQGSRARIRALLEVTGGSETRLRRKDGRRDRWEIQIEPSSQNTVTVMLSPSPPCGETGAVCTEDGRTFTTGLATQVHGPASGNNNWSEESAGPTITPVPALPLAGIGLLGLLLALLGSRAVLDDRRRLDASRGK